MKIPHLLVFLFLAAILLSGGCKSKPDKPESEMKQSKQETPQDAAQIAIIEQALRESALNGNTETAVQLLLTDINVNSVDQEGRTALMFASFNGHKAIVEVLLKEGADVDLRDFMDRTALLYASTGDFPETVELLLKNKADPNIIDNVEHFTSLMHAAAEGNLEVVKLLMNNGANPDLKDIDGDDAESFARRNGHIEVADYIQSKR